MIETILEAESQDQTPNQSQDPDQGQKKDLILSPQRVTVKGVQNLHQGLIPMKKTRIKMM